MLCYSAAFSGYGGWIFRPRNDRADEIEMIWTIKPGEVKILTDLEIGLRSYTRRNGIFVKIIVQRKRCSTSRDLVGKQM